MRVRTLVFSSVALAVILGFALVRAPHAAAAGTGTLSGVVVNGTHQSAPVANQTVTLEKYVNHGNAQPAGTTTTDAHGGFSFSGLDTGASNIYALSVKFQGGLYGSGVISFDNSAAQTATLTVYDATTSDAALSMESVTLLLSDPNTKRGTIPVGEFITFKNTGTRSFVGNVLPANGRPMGLLRFALPSGATNLSMGAGFAQTQIFQVATGFGVTGTVPPGTSQFAFAYDVPYRSDAYSLSLKAEYPTAKFTVLVPGDLSVGKGTLARQPDVTVVGQKYHVLETANVASDSIPTVRLTHLPLPGEAPVLNFGWLLAVVGLLLVLLAGLVGLYLRRGDLAFLLPGSRENRGAPAPENPDATGAEKSPARRRLLSELLALENRHRSGKVSEEDYLRARARLRGELKDELRENIYARDEHIADREGTDPAALTAASQRESLAGGQA
jgi:hypothetical protein